MLKNISSKTLSTIVLILIIVYGFFRIKVRIFFADSLSDLLNLIGIDPSLIISKLSDFAESPEKIHGILGWIIYYPTYFLLHITFIFLLFRNQIKVRNYLMLGLTVLIFLLVAFSLIGKLTDINLLYQVSYDAFQKLFGLPFILLFIEGGRILYKDVMGNQNTDLNQ